MQREKEEENEEENKEDGGGRKYADSAPCTRAALKPLNNSRGTKSDDG